MRSSLTLLSLLAVSLLSGCDELGLNEPPTPTRESVDPVSSESPDGELVATEGPQAIEAEESGSGITAPAPSRPSEELGGREAAAEPSRDSERVEAEGGVGKQGQSLTPGSMITEPARAMFNAKQNLIFANAEHALQLYKASTGSMPQSTEEYMEKVIKANRIKLPELRVGQRYVFDSESGKLLVERPK